MSAGACGFSGHLKEHQKTEGGYWLLPEYWGKGFLPEAFSTVCDYAFKHLDINRIECIVEPENHNSKRIMEKLNFQLEGRLRQAEKKEGTFIDIEYHAKLKDQSGF